MNIPVGKSGLFITDIALNTPVQNKPPYPRYARITFNGALVVRGVTFRRSKDSDKFWISWPARKVDNGDGSEYIDHVYMMDVSDRDDVRDAIQEALAHEGEPKSRQSRR